MKRWVLLGLLWFGTHSSLQAKSETVYYNTEDGAHIEATLSGEGTHGVVLAHGGQFTKSSWNKQVRILNDAGFRTLAINFRGESDPKSDRIIRDLFAERVYTRSGSRRIIRMCWRQLLSCASRDVARFRS